MKQFIALLTAVALVSLTVGVMCGVSLEERMANERTIEYYGR